MKRLFKITVLAVLSLAFASCEEEPSCEPIKELHFVVNSTESQTKSYFDNNMDGTYSPKWSKGDELAIFVGEINANTKITAKLSNVNESGSSVACFEGTASNVEEEGTFRSFVPAAAFVKAYANGTVGVTLNTVQMPSSITIDESCDILVAKPCYYMSDAGSVVVDDLYFKRLFSILKVNLTGADALKGESVKSFTITAPQPVILSGRAAVNLSEATVSAWNTNDNAITALYEADAPVFGGENGLENTVWLVVNPTTIASGSTLVFNAETANYNISKEVVLTKDMIFPESQIAVINLSINEGDYSAVTHEDRIIVEKFSNASVTKETYQPSETGVVGTGVSSEMTYVYTGSNTNIRLNANGHSSTDPYLYMSAANDAFKMNNIRLDNESSLKFSCQAKTNSGTAAFTVRYKESSAGTWNTAGTISASTSSFDTVQSVIFSVGNTVKSLDLQIVASAAVLVDDIILESYIDNRTSLAVPENVVAAVDGSVPNKVNVTWDSVENAGSYEIVFSASGHDDIVKTSSGSFVEAESLSYATEYSVKVKSVTSDSDNFIDSDYSEAVLVTTGEKPAGAAEWVSVPFADLKDGDKVVIVRTSGTSLALSNDNGTSAAPSAVAIACTGNKLNAEPAANVIWQVGIEDGGVVFYTGEDKTKWLYFTGTKANGVRVGTNAANTFTFDSNYLKHVGTSKYLGIYNNQEWRAYASCTGTSNIANQTFAFFVER